MNITVYLGASSGNDPTLETSVRALGHLIGESGNALVYGGSKNGLMGARRSDRRGAAVFHRQGLRV